MKKAIDRLRALRENGKIISTPNFIIMYNGFTDRFILDVPDDKKLLRLSIPHVDNETFIFDASGYYPYEVDAENYSMAWKDMKPFIHGATLDMMPSFVLNGKEIFIFDHDELGEIYVALDEITIIN